MATNTCPFPIFTKESDIDFFNLNQPYNIKNDGFDMSVPPVSPIPGIGDRPTDIPQWGKSLSGRVDSLEHRMGSLEKDVAGIKKDVSEIKAGMTKLKDEIISEVKQFFSAK